MKRLAVLVSLFSLTIFLLSGCTPRMYQSANKNVDNVQTQINSAREQFQQRQSSVVNESGMYVNDKPVPIVHQAAWLKRRVSLHGRNLPFDFYVNRLMNGTGVNVSYQQGANFKQRLSIDYSGSLKGALKRLEAKSDYSYDINGNNIMWSNMISRTFDISFMPGSSEYAVGGNTNSPGNVSGGTIYFGDSGSNRSQFSTLRGDLSVWNDLRDTLNKLKSAQGKVVVSQATTSVTVYDHPQNVQMMARYLKHLNAELSRQVALQVRVLEIDLNKNFNFGVNWNVVRRVMGVQFGLAGSLASPVGVNPLGNNPTPALAGIIVKGLSGHKWEGTDALINALEQQGKVSVVTEPRVVTLNNQVAEIGINTLTGYLEEVSTTQSGNNGQFLTQSLTPGVVKTGFQLYILPKVDGKKVYLQISSDISRLKNIQRISSSTSSSNNNQIQVPTVDEKNFNQRSEVGSGDTLVIAGFKQLVNEANNTKTFHVPSSIGAQKTNVETIVLITPTIIR